MKLFRFWWAAHNLLAHPLLVLFPLLGEWLHGYTATRMEKPDV